MTLGTGYAEAQAQPASPGTPYSCRCLLRSDTARLFDVIHALPAGRWAHVRRQLQLEQTRDWYASTQHDKELRTRFFHELDSTLLRQVDPTRQLTYAKDGRNVEGLYNYNDRLTARHSGQEGTAAELLDWDGRYERLVAQPFVIHYTVDGQWTKHYPDYFAIPTNKRTKPLLLDVTLQERKEGRNRLLGYAAAHLLAKQRGWRFEVANGSNLRAALTVDSMATGMRSLWDPADDSTRMVKLLRQRPMQLGDLADTSTSPARARGLIHRLLWTRRIHMDLRKRLCDATWLHA